MSDSTKTSSNLVVILGLAMALGPLTALSLGSKYAGEETRARAQAGLENAKPVDQLGRYESGTAPVAGKSIADVVSESALFDSFEVALKAAGADSILSGADTYTVFVPSDEGFAKLPSAQREALLKDKDAMAAWVAQHIVPGRYTATDLMQMREARTLNGDTIAVGPSANSNGHIGFGSAEVVKSNIQAANGIVHVIDRPAL